MVSPEPASSFKGDDANQAIRELSRSLDSLFTSTSPINQDPTGIRARGIVHHLNRFIEQCQGSEFIKLSFVNPNPLLGASRFNQFNILIRMYVLYPQCDTGLNQAILPSIMAERLKITTMARPSGLLLRPDMQAQQSHSYKVEFNHLVSYITLTIH